MIEIIQVEFHQTESACNLPWQIYHDPLCANLPGADKADQSPRCVLQAIAEFSTMKDGTAGTICCAEDKETNAGG
jgi:hypothetical protein